MRGYVALLLLALPAAGVLAGGSPVGGAGYATLPGGHFRSALKYEDRRNGVRIASFELMRRCSPSLAISRTGLDRRCSATRRKRHNRSRR